VYLGKNYEKNIYMILKNYLNSKKATKGNSRRLLWSLIKAVKTNKAYPNNSDMNKLSEMPKPAKEERNG